MTARKNQGSILSGVEKMVKKTDLEQVAGELKKTLVLAAKQSRKAKKISHDRMKNLSRLANCYLRFLNATGEVTKEKEVDPFEHGDPNYHDMLCNKSR